MSAYNLFQRGKNILLYILIELFISFIMFSTTIFTYQDTFLFIGLFFLMVGGILTIYRGSKVLSENINKPPKKSLYFRKLKNSSLDIYYYSCELIFSSFILILFSL